jgi:signal transduction histidine kinase
MTESATLDASLSEESVGMSDEFEKLASIGRMVSFVAHEMRSPLQNIRMGADIMRMEIGEDTQMVELLEQIDYGIDTLTEIVRELLEYSRPATLRRRPVSVHSFVEKALEALNSKLRNGNIYVKVELDDEEIEVDPHKMVQVLVNLISNAIDAMPAGEELESISHFLDTDGERVFCLTVSDTGCGIDSDNLDRVPEPFVTTKPHGVGLGLPVCRKIVRAHGGRLDIRSMVGVGTTIEIVLPITLP